MNSFYSLILEAALRALVGAAAVYAGLRILRIANVLVLKAAWALVLVAALTLPLVPHWQSLPAWAALKLPAFPAVSALRYAAPLASTKVQSSSQPALASSSNATPRISYSSRYPAPAISDSHFESASDTASQESSAAISWPEFSSAAPLEPRSASVPATSLPAQEPAAKSSVVNRIPLRLALALLLIYIGVTAALVLRLALGVISAIRLWTTAQPVSIISDATLMSAIPVRSSSRVASPVNIGSGILLPAEHRMWDKEKLRIVLAHERSHIRQGDFYLQLIAGLYASLFWFSPLGWWLKRKLYELGEAISDRAGLEEAGSRASYAQLLLEFAALPRPTLTGVAMARTSHLSQRIERLLNESSFRQAFAAGGRRAVLAVILVPAALLTATALVRVQAAPIVQDQPATLSGQSTAEQVTEPMPPPPPGAPAAMAAPEAMPAPPPPPVPDGEAMPVPPPPPDMSLHMDVDPMMVNPDINIGHMIPHVRVNPQISAIAPMPPMPPNALHINPRDFAYAYGFGQDGEPYAIVGEDGKVRHRSGWYRHFDSDDQQSEIDKARKQSHGAFLWFQHDGKSYIIDDPSVISQIDAMNKPMDDLQSQMKDLSKQMRAFSDQQREKARQMRDTSMQTPDLSKELAAIKAAEANLQAKQGGTISQKDIADLQREIGKIQGELGSLQGKLMGEQFGTMGKNWSEFGEQQGKLGGQMGKIGSEMGRIARENQSKMKDIITNSLSNGKAKQVQ